MIAVGAVVAWAPVGLIILGLVLIVLSLGLGVALEICQVECPRGTNGLGVCLGVGACLTLLGVLLLIVCIPFVG